MQLTNQRPITKVYSRRNKKVTNPSDPHVSELGSS